MSPIKNHTIIILASGLSLRLGHSKQLLSKYDQPLIRYMLKLALATEPQAVFIVIPQNNPAIVAAISELVANNANVIVVVNPKPEIGMAHSLYLAIEALGKVKNLCNDIDNRRDNRRVLIMGVDQALLDYYHLNNLLAGQQLVVASSYAPLNENFSINNAKPNIVGLPINIDYSLLKQWQSALTGDKGLRHLIRGLKTKQINTVINNKLSYDIDTPEQFAYAKRQHWLDH